MDYPKIVEMIPAEKWAPLSDQLIGVIMNSKNDKLPNPLALCFLEVLKQGKTGTKDGVSVLLETAVKLDAEKTVTALGDLQMLKIAELVVQGM
jgi:hypothetical protein